MVLANAFDHADRAQVDPLVVSRQPGAFFGDPVAPCFPPSVALGAGFQEVVCHAGKAVDLQIFEKALHLPVEAALVAFERQNIVGLRFADGLGNLFLATHGINGHDTAREVQRAQQLGNGRYFVALGSDLALAEHQPIFARPSADHVDGFTTLGAVMTAPQGLPVDGHDLGGKALAQALRPVGETLRKLPRIKEGEDASKSIMAGNPVGQFEKARQPIALGFAEACKLDKTLRPAKQRADGNHQNIMEGMRLGALHPRIGDEGKVKTKAFLGGFVGHPKLLSEVYKKVHF